MTRTLVWLLVAFLCAVALADRIIAAGYRLDIPRAFPCSVFSFQPHYAGAGWLALFLVVLLLAVRAADTLSLFQLWLVAFALVILANLGQGGVDAAFFKPLLGLRTAPRQYLHGVAALGDAAPDLLRRFNELQPDMYGVPAFCHVRTHPPFTTLLHYVPWRLGGPWLVAVLFMLVSSISVPLVASLTSRRVGLLFAVLPAVSIYSAVSVDGVVMAVLALFLWGVVRGKVWAVVAGLLAANALTFGAAWGAIVLLLLRRWRALGWSAGIGLLAYLACRFAGYDHLAAFWQTAVSENPAGTVGALTFGRATWTAVSDPGRYFMTRLEGAMELVLFLSLPVAVVLARQVRRSPVTVAAVAAFMVMLLLGVWCSGETARACLFLFPALMLPLVPVTSERLVLLAGVQTAVMQGLGDWFF